VMVESNVLTTTLEGNTRRGFIVEGVEPSSEFLVSFSENSVHDVENPVWVWKTRGVEFRNDDYRPYETGVQVVNCNPFDLQNPTASSNVFAFGVNISNTVTGYLLKDEPNDNSLCLKSNRPFVELSALEGVISNADVGLRTVGSQVSATNFSVYTDHVDTQVSREANSQGNVASDLQVPPDCPVCLNNGTCAGINICACREGYHEIDCSVEICGDNICTHSENLENCFSDCDLAVVPPECANHRGFDEGVINYALTRSAINKNIQKLDLLLSDLKTTKESLPGYIDTCCTPSSALEYPLSEVSVSQISSSSFAFHQTLLQFNQDNEVFKTVLTE